jgi:hypothetical protein
MKYDKHQRDNAITKKKLLAVKEFFLTGSIRKVSRSLRIPERTIHGWKRQAWWSEELELLQRSIGQENRKRVRYAVRILIEKLIRTIEKANTKTIIKLNPDRLLPQLYDLAQKLNIEDAQDLINEDIVKGSGQFVSIDDIVNTITDPKIKQQLKDKFIKVQYKDRLPEV